MANRFTVIKMPDLGAIKEKMDKLRAEVCSLTESHTSAIPPFIPPVVQLTPLPGPKYFDLFVEDDEVVSIVWT